MPPSTKKKKSAIKRRKKRALANAQPSSPSYSQQQQEENEEDDDFKTHDEKEPTNGDINIETSANDQRNYHDQLVEKDKNSSFIGDNNKPITKNSTKESKEEMAGDKETGDSESGKVHVEFHKKSDKGGSSSSSDSSSDDESKIAKKIRSSKKKVLGVFKDGVAGINSAFAGILPSEHKVEKIAVSSSEDSVEKIVSSVEEKVESSSSGSILPAVPLSVDTSYDGGENSKVPETHESPEKQELLPIVPITVQPASWKSCCGLFDVLTGSNR